MQGHGARKAISASHDLRRLSARGFQFLKPSPSRGGLGGDGAAVAALNTRINARINTIPTPALPLKGREKCRGTSARKAISASRVYADSVPGAFSF